MKNSEQNSKKKENFKLAITEKAKKEISRLPVAEIQKLDTKIQKLPHNPFPKGVRKLVGSKQTYRIRQGNYRILYEVEGDEIIVMSVGHRRDVYG